VDVTPGGFAEGAEDLCRSQEQPHAGLPIAAYAAVHAALREAGFIVVMDGSGFDEQLAGYDRFRPAYWADLRRSGDWATLEREVHAAGLVNESESRLAARQMDIAEQPESDAGWAQDLTRSVRTACITEDLRAAGVVPPVFDRPFDDLLHNMMYRELRYTKLPRALRFRDRLSMAVGTELRPPFLDHRLVAYSFALPSTDLISNGVQKAILRRATADTLPETLRLASKRSVQTPQREWFRGPLRGFISELVDSPSFWQRGWIDRKRGRAAMDAFLGGDGDNSFFLWQWANLELWARAFLDAPPRDR
jgi:asparagine synthase (glutamine-hydrolysing)